MDPLDFEDVEDLPECAEFFLEEAFDRSRISSRNSLKTLSNPGCICRAIIGKLLRSPLKVFTSFLSADVEAEVDFSLEDSAEGPP